MELDMFSKQIAFGLVPFETVYVERSVPHFLEQHYKRLKRACAILHVELPLDFAGFRAKITDYLDNSGFNYGALKVAVYGGDAVFNTRAPSYDEYTYRRGLNICISKASRGRKNILNYLKTYNYGTNYMEDARAKKRGFDTCLFLNEAMEICETAYANIFFRKGDVLYTPGLSAGILNGIMRRETVKFARGGSYNVIFSQFGKERLPDFEECFITNSIAGVFPVAAIEECRFESRSFADAISREQCFAREWNR